MTHIINNLVKLLAIGVLLVVTGVSAQTPPGPGATNTEQLLEVTVSWNRSATEAVATGTPYVRFSSNGLVERTKPQPVFLTITPVSNGPSVDVCTFGLDAGSRFAVSYPACATGSQNSPQLVGGSSIFATGNEYYVTFTDQNGNIINSPDGDSSYLLPVIPAPGLPNNLLEIESTVRSHPDGGEYYVVTIDVNQTIPGQNLEILLRSAQNAVFVEPALGTIPIVAGRVTLPATVPAESLADGTYELVARYNGVNYEIAGLNQRIGQTSGSTGSGSSTGGSSTGGLFNTTQLDIMDRGLVPDCGYDIRTLSNENGAGRMCGLTDAIVLIQRVIEYVFILILPIAAVVFAFVGYLFITSGGNPDKRSKARKAMLSLVIGIVIIMAAWLLVKTILLSLGVDTGIAEQFLDLST